ncbi:MAG: hypothetical protein QOK28_441 [Actinomycetota bacterium]|jgi:hypothetical protein
MTRTCIGLVLVVAVVSGACGLGERDAQATRIVHAGERLLKAPSVTGVLEARVQIVKSDKPIAPGPARIAPEHVNEIGVVINAPARTAEVGTNTPSGKPAILFAGGAIYQRIAAKSVQVAGNRLTASVPSNFNALAAEYSSQLVPAPEPATTGATTSSSIASPNFTLPTTTTTSTTAAPSLLRRRVQIVREWAAFDYAGIADHDKTKHAGSIAVNPVDLLRLTKGVLTGSIERRGAERESLVRYDANVSRDKAERGLSEHARKVLDKEFKANAVTRRVFPAKFWLDTHGDLKRFEVKLRQQLTSIDRGDLTLSLDLAPAPNAVVIKKPGRRGTVRVHTLGELVTTVTGQ